MSVNCPKCGGELSKIELLFKQSACPRCGEKIQAKYPAISTTVTARIFVACVAAFLAPSLQESPTFFYLIIAFVILLVIYLIAKFAMDVEVTKHTEDECNPNTNNDELNK